jgi:uncharacterized delta-60 repeat protein
MFKTNRWKNRICCFSFVLILLLAQIIFAAGERDPNFGTGGSVTVNFGGGMNVLSDAALQPDGKILVVGSAGTSQSQTSFALARLNADGTPDASFGAGGKVITNLDNNLNTAEHGHSIAIQPDGKLVVGGDAQIVSGNSQISAFAIVRYNADGTLDQSFGTGGKVFTVLQGIASTGISKILLQSDGKLLAFGEYTSANQNGQILVVRYKTDGQEDNTFRAPSRLFISYPTHTRFDDAALQQPDDRILISGRISYTNPNCNQKTEQCQITVPFLTRYNSNFILDRKFGRKLGREIGGMFDDFTSMSVLPDGNLVVAGRKIRRYTANGRLETIFAEVSETTEQAAQKFDGKVIGCGSVGIGALNRDVITSLYNPNGTLIGTDRIDIGSQDFCREILSQADGKFLVAGTAMRSSGTLADFFLVRYLNIAP